MKKKLKVLLADDDKTHRTMLATLLGDWGYEVLPAADGQEAMKLFQAQSPDLALVDVRMPKANGMEVLEGIKAKNSSFPVIIMTAFSEVPAAVEAIRKGAYDYLTKPLDFSKLETTLKNAISRLGLEGGGSRFSSGSGEAKSGPQILGQSPAMQKLGEMIRTIAPTEATVLISGESGTGKELAARAVHAASHRAAGPFIALNCGAMTGSLLTSELFGHEKGAFTGADRKHQGLFLEAGGGSIFLDEIGEMPLEMQVKLLRVLQEREVLSVGGKKPQPIDCRVIAATNKDLAEEVAKGNFREDLYYRLNVVSLKMPPLRERAEDIPLLAEKFARKFAAVNHKTFSGISEGAMRLLQKHSWPGNVRELENVIERAIILMPGEYISEHELPDRVRQNKGRPREIQEDGIFETGSQELPTLEEVERKVILRTLEKMGNNKTEAAKALGITRKTLHAKLNRYKDN